MKIHLFTCFFLLWGIKGYAAPPEDPKQYFGEQQGCFLLNELWTQTYLKIATGDCDERHSPASTFKIPHALIGLESGVIKNPNDLVLWNKRHYRSPHWNQDHTLYSAMKYSVVPYFMQLASHVGSDTIRQHLKQFNYGNQYLVTRHHPLKKQKHLFWLNGELTISATEQLSFLKRMYENQLDVQAQNLKIVKDALIQKSGRLSNSMGEHAFDLQWGNHTIFSAKTGGTKKVVWLVGHIKEQTKEFVFVSVIPSRQPPSAINVAKQILNNYYRDLNMKSHR